MKIAIVAVILAMFVNAFLASLMRSVAISKGYHNTPVFALVFFFGIFGILYVISLPDLVARQQQKSILDLLYAINNRQENSDVSVPTPISVETLEALNDRIKPDPAE